MMLNESIQAAFADVPYPGDQNIIHCSYNCRLCQEVVEYFKGKTQRGHSIEELRDHHIALSLFTPEAFQYFLPAFMLASLESYDQIHLLPDSIRVHFDFNLEHRDHFQVQIENFTAAQRNVIIEFFRFMESKGAGSSEDAIGLLQEQRA